MKRILKNSFVFAFIFLISVSSLSLASDRDKKDFLLYSGIEMSNMRPVLETILGIRIGDRLSEHKWSKLELLEDISEEKYNRYCNICHTRVSQFVPRLNRFWVSRSITEEEKAFLVAQHIQFWFRRMTAVQLLKNWAILEAEFAANDYVTNKTNYHIPQM